MPRLLTALLALLLGACSATPATTTGAPLLDTYWKALELEGAPVETGPGRREVHLMLRREPATASGFSGCNNVRGGYELQGENLRFRQMASTLMACLPGADDTGQRYNSALAATAAFRVSGDTLELRDREGRVRARFSAQPRH